MLGDLIYEAKGKTLGLRVLDDNGTIEMTNMENGVILGFECTAMITLVCKRRPDGIQYSEGHAVISTKDGDAATSNVSCIIIPKGQPPLSSVRGASFYYTQSPKLARLNKLVCIFEGEINEDMSYTMKKWEWK